MASKKKSKSKPKRKELMKKLHKKLLEEVGDVDALELVDLAADCAAKGAAVAKALTVAKPPSVRIKNATMAAFQVAVAALRIIKKNELKLTKLARTSSKDAAGTIVGKQVFCG